MFGLFSLDIHQLGPIVHARLSICSPVFRFHGLHFLELGTVLPRRFVQMINLIAPRTTTLTLELKNIFRPIKTRILLRVIYPDSHQWLDSRNPASHRLAGHFHTRLHHYFVVQCAPTKKSFHFDFWFFCWVN